MRTSRNTGELRSVSDKEAVECRKRSREAERSSGERDRKKIRNSESGGNFPFFYQLLKDDAAPFRNQHQIRRFITAAYNHPDDSLLISKLGQGAGLCRLREICEWPMLIDAGDRADKISFQRVVVPLMRLVTKSEIQQHAIAIPKPYILDSAHVRKF